MYIKYNGKNVFYESTLSGGLNAIWQPEQISFVDDTRASILLQAAGFIEVKDYSADNTQLQRIVDPNNYTIQSIKDMALSLKSTGGTIIFPPGTYIVEGLPLFPGVRYEGFSSGNDVYGGSILGSTLKLPDTPTNHMFVAKRSADDPVYGFSGGYLSGCDIVNFNLDGNQSSIAKGSRLFDCINMDSLNTGTAMEVQSFMIHKNKAHDFRCFYRNNCTLANCRDRAPNFAFNEIWENWAAIYTNEHPRFSGRNDIRYNTYGLTGIQMYDIEVINQAFVYCDYAISPQSGFNIGRCTITNNFFVGNLRDIDLSGGSFGPNIVSTNIFAPANPLDTPGASLYSIKIDSSSSRSSIENNVFDCDDSRYYSQSILVANNTSAILQVGIDRNTFIVKDTKLMTFTSTADISQCSFNGNKIWIRSGTNVNLIDASSVNWVNCDINDNKVRVQANCGSTTDLFKFTSAFTSGLSFQGNRCVSENTTWANNLVNANFTNGGILTGNSCRNINMAISAKDLTTVPNNSIAAQTTPAADTAVIKTHNVVR